MTRDHRATPPDALSEFASEPVPPPATSELDALVDAASAGALSAFPSEADTRPAGAPTPVNDRWRWTVGVSMQPIALRWVAAPLAAFAVGAALVAWGLRTIEPAAPSIARATPPAETSATPSATTDVAQETSSAATTSMPVPSPEPASAQAAANETPMIETDTVVGTPPGAVRRSAAAAAAVTVQNGPPVEAPPAPQPLRATAPAPVRESAPAPLRASASTAARAAALVPLPPAALPRSAPEPLMPAPGPAAFDARAILPSAIAEPPPIAPAPVKAVAVAAVVVEERAVRDTLETYADAFAGMDVQATAAVWPSVDRRALTRAFATLKSQGLTFTSCTIDVNDASATAHCRGTVQFVRKIGNPTPLTAPQQWRFVMRKLGATWTIEEVTATRDSVASARAE